MNAAPDGKTVLVVEDDPALNALLADLFELNGYRVLRAYDGREAYAMIGEQRPDVVTLDLMLPGMLGQDILRQAKREPLFGDVRFVVVSAWCQGLTEADLALADAVFGKPFDVEELLGAVDNLARQAS